MTEDHINAACLSVDPAWDNPSLEERNNILLVAERYIKSTMIHTPGDSTMDSACASATRLAALELAYGSGRVS